MGFTSWRVARKSPRAGAMRRWVVMEARTLASVMREPQLWWLLLAMALCGSLAYRAPYSFALDIGGSPRNCFPDAVFDTPYISGFNSAGTNGGVEFDVPAERCAEARVAYRWAFEQASVHLPGVGRAVFRVVLTLASGQPGGSPVLSAWYVDGQPVLALPLKSSAQTYHLLTPPPRSADLALQFETPTFQPPEDSRELAFAADQLHVASVSSVAPDWAQLALLSLLIGLSYGLFRRWLLPVWPATGVVVVLIGGLAALLVWQRQGLTSFSDQVLRLVLAAAGLALLLEPLAHGLARRLYGAVSRREARIVAALVVLAWLVRTLGLFHPQTYSSDIGLNINNLIGVTRGEIIFTEALPSDAGGGDAPYPPAQYIILMPWHLLGLDLRTLLIAASALADSLAILWLWLIVRGTGGTWAAAVGAGLLYLFATPLLRSLSTGELANVWGQALVLPWALVLLRWRARQASTALLGLVTAIALLGHSGVFLSLVLLLVTLGGLLLVRRDRQVWQFGLAVGIAVLAVVIGYYLVFWDVVRERPAGALPTTTAIERLGFELSEFVRWSGQIGPLLTLLSLSGLVLAWRSNPWLGELLAAWWLAVLASWSTLLFSQQALRWEAFLLPALALSGGLAVGAAWQRRGALQAGALATVALVLAQGGALWIERLVTYR